jgi:hypothetical protein
MTFRRDIMNWPSRGVIATHDYGCQPTDAAGLERIRQGIERREAAMLDARARKALHLAAMQAEGIADEQLRPPVESDSDGQRPSASR